MDDQIKTEKAAQHDEWCAVNGCRCGKCPCAEMPGCPPKAETDALRTDEREALARALGCEFHGPDHGECAACAAEAERVWDEGLEAIVAAREARARYFAFWHYFLRLPTSGPYSDMIQREALRLRALCPPSSVVVQPPASTCEFEASDPDEDAAPADTCRQCGRLQGEHRFPPAGGEGRG